MSDCPRHWQSADDGTCKPGGGYDGLCGAFAIKQLSSMVEREVLLLICMAYAQTCAGDSWIDGQEFAWKCRAEWPCAPRPGEGGCSFAIQLGIPKCWVGVEGRFFEFVIRGAFGVVNAVATSTLMVAPRWASISRIFGCERCAPNRSGVVCGGQVVRRAARLRWS